MMSPLPGEALTEGPVEWLKRVPVARVKGAVDADEHPPEARVPPRLDRCCYHKQKVGYGRDAALQ